MKKIVFRILSVILILILCLLTSEIILRLTGDKPSTMITLNKMKKSDISEKKSLNLFEHPEEGGVYIETQYGRRLRPNTEIIIENHALSKKKVLLKINSIGYRNPEILKKTVNRILFLGDSITFGDYLSEEETFVRLIEELLRKKNKTSETINAGVGSIGIENELMILKETGLNIYPDVVILGFYLNDFEQSPGIKMIQLPSILKKLWIANKLAGYATLLKLRLLNNIENIYAVNNREVKRWINEVQDEYKLTSKDSFSETESFYNKIHLNARDWGLAWSKNAWLNMSVFFYEFKRLSEIHNFKFYIIVFPVREQVESSTVFDFPQHQIKMIGEKLNIKILDLLPVLRETHRKNNVFENGLFYDQCHYTPEGNTLIAEHITEFLLENNAVK